MTWKKGESGNPSGHQWNRPFWDAIRRACAQDDYKRLRQAAEKLLDMAAEGVPWAVQMLADRTDGRPIQALRHSGPDGEAIPLFGTLKFVRPEDSEDDGRAGD